MVIAVCSKSSMKIFAMMGEIGDPMAAPRFWFVIISLIGEVGCI